MTKLSTLQKLSLLEHYSVGQTDFDKENKRYMAHSFYQALEDYGHLIPEDEPDLPILYGKSIKKVVNKAYKYEIKQFGLKILR